MYSLIATGVVIIIAILIMIIMFSKKFSKKSEQFSKTVKFADNDEIKIVFFFAPWCGFCTKIFPQWDRLHKKFNQTKSSDGKVLKLIKINSTIPHNKDYVKKYKITGFPTIQIHKKGGAVIQYSGDRTYSDMQKWIQDHS